MCVRVRACVCAHVCVCVRVRVRVLVWGGVGSGIIISVQTLFLSQSSAKHYFPDSPYFIFILAAS